LPLFQLLSWKSALKRYFLGPATGGPRESIKGLLVIDHTLIKLQDKERKEPETSRLSEVLPRSGGVSHFTTTIPIQEGTKKETPTGISKAITESSDCPVGS